MKYSPTTVIAAALMMLAAACSHEEVVDPNKICEEHIATFDASRHLDYAQYDALLQRETELFDSLRTDLASLSEITDSARLASRVDAHRADVAFNYRIDLSERIWRVLVLGQPGFSTENLEKFNALIDSRRLIDFYNENISRHLR